MPALNLEINSDFIAYRLQDPVTLLVACLCAEWCSSCRDYKSVFWKLADTYPKICFVWIDIETHADWLDDLIIENFPTILIEDNSIVQFFGAVLPNTSIIERMLKNIDLLPRFPYAPKLRSNLAQYRKV